MESVSEGPALPGAKTWTLQKTVELAGNDGVGSQHINVRPAGFMAPACQFWEVGVGRGFYGSSELFAGVTEK